MGYNLLLYWGYNPLILTIDPNFLSGTSKYQLANFSQRHCFQLLQCSGSPQVSRVTTSRIFQLHQPKHVVPVVNLTGKGGVGGTATAVYIHLN